MSDSRIEEKLDKLDEKVERLNEVNHKQDLKLEKLSVISDENQVILKAHQRRSLANENRLEKLEGFLKGFGSVTVVVGIIATLLGIVLTLNRLGLI